MHKSPHKKGGNDMRLSKLLSMLMHKVDVIEYYNKNMTFLYDFDIAEIPEDCKDIILKFNIFERDNKRILEVIEK